MEDELIKDKDNICLESGKQPGIQPFVNRGGKWQEDQLKWKQFMTETLADKGKMEKEKEKEGFFLHHTPGNFKNLQTRSQGPSDNTVKGETGSRAHVWVRI